jgi:Leucine-rich repeat (LRR) protein
MKAVATGLVFRLVLMACSFLAVTCSSINTTHGNQNDRLSLLEFKNSISLDPQQALASWNDSIHFCNWEGVSCGTTRNRVTNLELGNRGLVGQISPSLGNLTFLKHLSLATNRFSGQIPASLGQLHHLQTLYLSNNTLHGVIPTFQNCSKLEKLWLDGNNLLDGFPGLPLELKQLELGSNNLSGTIPPSLANITTLQALGFNYNSIEGNFPHEFAKFPGLQSLRASANHLVGSFPQVILNLSALVTFGIAENHLSGEVPPGLGSSLPNLQKLAIDYNFFHGDIPSTLLNASDLHIIDISSNSFTGVVPSSIGKLRNLYLLNLELNKLKARNSQDWEFLYSLGNCTNLQILSLYSNQLEGHVPTSIGNISVKLQILLLGYNQLSGGFPSGIANLHNLIWFELEGNQFTGKVPEWLGALNSLQRLSLNNNNFTGFIPPSLSNLSRLSYLRLQSNKLKGHLPSSIGYLQNLQVCNFSNNLLHGGIPKEMFGIPAILHIDLSANHLQGQLPYELGNAKALEYLNLSSNMLSGDIPTTIGNCEKLEYIGLQQNSFGGSIPILLGNIWGLEILDLSHNNLTGSIPMSLSNLQYLEQLDLSFNNISGEVPLKGIFSNKTAVQIDGNPGLCGGRLELHLQACHVTPINSSKQRHSIVQKVVIPLCSILSLVIVITGMVVWRGNRKRSMLTLPSLGSKFPKVSYNDLAQATCGFSSSNLIGEGRYSSVYKGELLQDRTMVAIKVFHLDTWGAQKSFIAECNTLRKVRHRNLVPILTACSSIDSNGNDFKALVYEFMTQGDLHELLYATRCDGKTSTRNRVTMAQRLSIAVDVADALEYLHHGNQGTIVHCDLKPSNILLDDNMTAHVGDFGLARFKFDSTASPSTYLMSTSVAIMGTIGYIPPGNQNQNFMQHNVFMYVYHWTKQFFCVICRVCYMCRSF